MSTENSALTPNNGDESLTEQGENVKNPESSEKTEKQVSFKILQSLFDDIDQAVEEHKRTAPFINRTSYLAGIVAQHREIAKIPGLIAENQRLSGEITQLKIAQISPETPNNPGFPAIVAGDHEKELKALNDAIEFVSKDIAKIAHVSPDFVTSQVEFYFNQILPQL